MLKGYCHISSQRPPNCLIANLKNIVIFEANALNFALLQNLVQKIKILKFGTKNTRFPYFGAGISKYYCHIWNQSPRICLAVKFGAKTKILKFGSKNTCLGIFGLELKIILPYLKSATLNLSNSRILWKKQKCLNLEPKMPHLGIFYQKCLVWAVLG